MKKVLLAVLLSLLVVSEAFAFTFMTSQQSVTVYNQTAVSQVTQSGTGYQNYTTTQPVGSGTYTTTVNVNSQPGTAIYSIRSTYTAPSTFYIKK